MEWNPQAREACGDGGCLDPELPLYRRKHQQFQEYPVLSEEVGCDHQLCYEEVFQAWRLS